MAEILDSSSSSLPKPELLKKRLPEWGQLESLIPELSRFGEVSVIGKSSSSQGDIPLVGMSFGSRDPKAPVLGLFGGVHGLERIGAQVCLALLKSFSEHLLWDSMIHESLKKIRIVAVPMINPLGMMSIRRANPNGVDLMRNAPIDAEGKATWLLGGHRISNKLPWYRGALNAPMEPENQAVFDFCQREFFQSEKVITVDFHSGFGVQDQIWFPYAKSTQAFPHIAEMHALKEVFERTHPHHFYRVEPQAKNYTTHGDLWDYIYEVYRSKNSGVYLPLAVEMGSWMWVKKNPLQLFSALGPYNPVKPHRKKRILRRHQTLFDFLIRSLVSPQAWTDLDFEQKNKHEVRSRELWYPQGDSKS